MQINAQVMTLLHFLTSKETPRGARTFVRKYGSTEVLSYFRTKVLSKVLSYFRKYEGTFGRYFLLPTCTCTVYTLHVLYCTRTVHVKQLTYSIYFRSMYHITSGNRATVDTSVSLPYLRRYFRTFVLPYITSVRIYCISVPVQ